MADNEIKRCPVCPGGGKVKHIKYDHLEGDGYVVCESCGLTASLKDWNSRPYTMGEKLVEINKKFIGDGYTLLWRYNDGSLSTLLMPDGKVQQYLDGWSSAPDEAVRKAWEINENIKGAAGN